MGEVIVMVDYGLIGKQIKKHRLHADLTQEVLAEKCNLTTEYLSKIENGKVHPTIDTLANICELLDFDMSELFSGVIVGLTNYRTEDIVLYYQKCSPKIKPVALDLVKKLSEIE